GLSVLAAMFVRGDRLDRAAVENGRVYLDTVSGKIEISGNEKVTKPLSLFSAAPFVQTFFNKKLNIYYTDSFFFTNSELKPIQVHWKIAQKEGFLKSGESLELNLEEGEYVLEINMMLSDGLVLHSKSPIAILAGPPGENVGLKESFRIGDQQGNIYTEPYRA